MGNLRKGLIGAVAGFGEGMAVVGQDQLKKNAELAKALREEAMQLKSFAHAETMQKSGFEHAENLQGKSFEHTENLQEKGQTHAETMQGKGFTHAENLQEGGFKHAETQQQQAFTHAETLQSQDQQFKTGLAEMEKTLKERELRIKESELSKMEKSNQIAIIKNNIATIAAANKHLELGGSSDSANAILEEGGINLEYKNVVTRKGEKGFFSDTPEETTTVLGKKGLISDAANPLPIGPQGDVDLDKLLERGRNLTGSPGAQSQGQQVAQKSGMIAGEAKAAPTIPEDLPADLAGLDSMVKKLPVEMDGIYKKSPSWERGRNISEGISSVTGQSQATQDSDILRKGEDDLTKAIRIATGKTDVYELNIIADKLKTIYKDKLSDEQLSALIKEGKLLGGEKTGA